MEQHEETAGEAYPRGRGYGHDYMRGGEVFGGYGYSERDEYGRPRGEITDEGRAPGEELAPSEEERIAEEAADAEALERGARRERSPDERFPQDERAGGWEIPHDLDDALDDATGARGASPGAAPGTTTAPAAPAATTPLGAASDGAGRMPAPGEGHDIPALEGKGVGADAPVPQIERTFGDTGGNRLHSRSYYVTQAQLQQRLYGTGEEARKPPA